MLGPSIITRRSMLQGLVLMAGAASTRAHELVVHDVIARLVYDSRVPASLDWRGGFPLPAIDLAQQHANLWRELRTVVPDGRIAGLTRWSDHVLARTLLQEKGMRMRIEVRRGDLYYWEMC